MYSDSIVKKQRLAALPRDIDIDKIHTSELMDNVKTKYSRISYTENLEPLLIQTNTDNIVNIEQKTTCVEVYILLTAKENGKFIEFINGLEDHFMRQAILNRKIWFKDMVDVKFRSLWKNDRLSDDKIIKIKIPNSMKMSLLHIDASGKNSGDVKDVSVNMINKDLPIRFILYIDLLYFYGNVFGVNIIPVNIQQLIECEYVYQDSNLCTNSLSMLNAELTEQALEQTTVPPEYNEYSDNSSISLEYLQNYN